MIMGGGIADWKAWIWGFEKYLPFHLEHHAREICICCNRRTTRVHASMCYQNANKNAITAN